MSNTPIWDAHIALVEAVNNAKTEREHWEAGLVLQGFRQALKVVGNGGYTHQLIECDMHYLDNGTDRPMCCGVFLDWVPEGLTPNEDMNQN